MDGSSDLEYLQFSCTGYQTVYTATYPHPGSDRLFAKGSRLLVKRTKQPHESWYYRLKTILSITGVGRAVVNWCKDLWQQYQLSSLMAALSGVQRDYVVMTQRRPFSQRGYQWDGCCDYV